MKDNLRKREMEWREIHISSVYKVRTEKLFHYTTLDNVWKILESDTLYARHVRFSNDSEEYQLGKDYIQKLSGHDISNVNDCYMICFCRKGNILSQWREYARGGVSLEFDFKNTDYYTIKCNSITENKNRLNSKDTNIFEYKYPAKMFIAKRKYYYTYAKPIEVKYLKSEKELKSDYKTIKKNIGKDKDIIKGVYFNSLIPYIKHKGFQEEKEVRLIFSPPHELAEYQVDYLNYNGFQKPYIKVEFGLAEKKQNNHVEVVYSQLNTRLLNRIKENIKKSNNIQKVGKQIIVINLKKDEDVRENEIIIKSCKGQKIVFDFINQYVKNYNDNKEKKSPKVKIWCEGHLPIRKIFVGPCDNKKEIKESIEQKKKSLFWLEYVDVVCSDIPYRQKA